jgi:hypothetical protein
MYYACFIVSRIHFLFSNISISISILLQIKNYNIIIIFNINTTLKLDII